MLCLQREWENHSEDQWQAISAEVSYLQRKGVQMTEPTIPMFQCSRGCSLRQTLDDMGHQAWRLGVMPYEPPRPKEILVARIRTERYGPGYPVFSQDQRLTSRVARLEDIAEDSPYADAPAVSTDQTLVIPITAYSN